MSARCLDQALNREEKDVSSQTSPSFLIVLSPDLAVGNFCCQRDISPLPPHQDHISYRDHWENVYEHFSK